MTRSERKRAMDKVLRVRQKDRLLSYNQQCRKRLWINVAEKCEAKIAAKLPKSNHRESEIVFIPASHQSMDWIV